MSAKVSWLIEKRVVLIVVDETISLESVKQMNQDMIHLFEEGDAPVHVVFDAKKMKFFPITIAEVSSVMEFLKHSKLGWSMSIVPNPVVTFIGKVVNTIMQHKDFRFVNSIEEGLEILYRVDSSLPSSVK